MMNARAVEAIQNMPHPAPLNMTRQYSDGFIDGRNHAVAAVRSLGEPRPEHVVKAEALRELAADPDTDTWVRQWARKKADELDPPIQSGCAACPAEPTGDRAVVRDRHGDVWVREADIGVTDIPWLHQAGGRMSWPSIVISYGPVTVLSDGVGEPS